MDFGLKKAAVKPFHIPQKILFIPTWYHLSAFVPEVLKVIALGALGTDIGD
ncbi:MAG: hypothetical protein KME26_11875 [Oscillatoria princeps RMCB-10]|nr:hypothetical protein [Oscillatoria princeps RMCB-10]